MEEQSETPEETEDPAAQGSGERPESPEEGTKPPGNPDVDEKKVEEAEEDLDATKPY